MEELVNINDGSQNLGRAVWDMRENTLAYDAYVIRQTFLSHLIHFTEGVNGLISLCIS